MKSLHRHPPTQKELRWIEDRWLQKFHQGSFKSKATSAQWLEVITDFLEWRGDEIISLELRNLEESIIGLEREEDYFSALLDEVKPDVSASESEKAVLMVTASPSQRVAALKKVLR